MRKTVAPMSLLTPEQLASLARVDSPTVANVIELFDVRPSYLEGFTNHTVKAVYPELPPVVGYAWTATFALASSRRKTTPTEACHS